MAADGNMTETVSEHKKTIGQAKPGTTAVTPITGVQVYLWITEMERASMILAEEATANCMPCRSTDRKILPGAPLWIWSSKGVI